MASIWLIAKRRFLYHTTVIPGGTACKDSEGRFIHENVWLYLFTHPVDQTGEPDPADTKICNLLLKNLKQWLWIKVGKGWWCLEVVTFYQEIYILHNNTLMLERFMSMFAINPNTPKNQKIFKELLNYGKIAAQNLTNYCFYTACKRTLLFTKFILSLQDTLRTSSVFRGFPME